MQSSTDSFEAELSQRLTSLRTQGLYRELRRIDSPQSPRLEFNGRSLLNFSSNDYLGLANEPLLKEAAIKAIERFGAGAGASRLVCGSLAPHHELEEVIADFKGTPAALSFSTGYAAAIGTICALMTKDDVIVIDRLAHASLVDAAHLCGAKLRVFAHNDLNDLTTILQWADSRKNATTTKSRVLVITESVFSMDGDYAPLPEIVELKEKHGAWLMLDEAHATGLYGLHRRGLAEHFSVSHRIEIQMGTLGKALGASGGYVCGSRTLVDYLINRARSFIFSTAPVPAAAAAATAGIQFVRSPAGDERRSQLWTNVSQLESGLGPLHDTRRSADIPVRSKLRVGKGKQLFHRTRLDTNLPAAIIPLIIGDEAKAVEASLRLIDLGIYIPAIRYPSVARGQARLRLTLTAAHQPPDIAEFCSALKTLEIKTVVV